MMKPMFESMQQGVRAGNGPLDPFGAGFQPPRVAAAPVAVPAAVSTCSSSSDSGCGDKKASGGVLIDPATYSPTDVVISMPIKSQNKDSGLLSKVLEKFRNSKSSDGSGRLMMSPEELHLFTGAVETLQARPAEGSTAFSEAVYALMMRIISDHPTVQCALFYTFQLMMLYEANVGSCYLLRAMQGVAHMLDPNVTLPYEMSGPANFLAVCTLSNYFSRLPRHSSCPSILTPMLDVVIDVCTLYISKDYTNCPNRPELRQWTASLLHNIVLFQQHAGGWNRVTTGGEIHPHVVQVLCGVVEDISDEADVVVLHRRLSVAYNLLVFYPDLRALFKDVGFNLVYQDLKSRRASSLSVLTAVVDKTLGLLG